MANGTWASRGQAAAMMLVPEYSGFYINLDRSTQRRATVESQLAALGLTRSYSRFTAVDGTKLSYPTSAISSGELGCFVSHARLLRACADLGKHVHVLEDDVLLSAELAPALHELITRRAFDQIDLIFSDVFVPIDCDRIAEYEQLMQAVTQFDEGARRETVSSLRLIDLRGRLWAATSSYVVADRSVDRVAGLLENELKIGPRGPVDLVLRQLVSSGALTAACVMPFLTSVDLAGDFESTTRQGASAQVRSRVASNIVRQMFFVRPDWGTISKIVQQQFPPTPKPLRQEIINRMLDFRVFGDFQRF